eukprot:4886386-Alexandrium_andersonii.AAC.1
MRSSGTLTGRLRAGCFWVSCLFTFAFNRLMSFNFMVFMATGGTTGKRSALQSRQFWQARFQCQPPHFQQCQPPPLVACCGPL